MADQNSIIPYGFCQCGCGERTNRATITNTKRGVHKGQFMKFISGHNARLPGRDFSNIPRGDSHYNWHGGISHDRRYTLIYDPDHPRSISNKYVYEHVLIAGNALGKELPPNAVVHHHTPEQLVICEDQAYHLLLHQRTRAFRACGHATWRKCAFCKQYDDIENLLISGSNFKHRKCYNEWQIKMRKIRKQKKLLNNTNINPFVRIDTQINNNPT